MVTNAGVTRRDSVDKNELIDKLIQLAKEEQDRGNTSVTEEKLNNLANFVQHHQRARVKEKGIKTLEKPLPQPKYPPLYHKYNLPKQEQGERKTTPVRARRIEGFSIKRLERSVIGFLEGTANVLDNLHLISHFPMFPGKLKSLLKQTNKLWVLILIFLLRKTVSQLLNVLKKENKVKVELGILRRSNAKVLDQREDDQNIFKRYEKFLKDLKFDKTMLILELIGNLLDLAFNVVELYGLPVPDWFMSGLNFASMFMTIYRMNKDDEYIDDDISEDVI